MAIKSYRDHDSYDYRYEEFVCDTDEDVNKLPKNVAPGSVAIVADNGEVYILNTQGQWKKL